MAKQLISFEANDGTVFATEHQADAHNTFLAAEGSIEAYIEFAELGGAQAGLLRKHVAGFLSFQERDDHDERVEATNARIADEKAAAKAAKEAEKAAAKALAAAAAQLSGNTSAA